MQLTMLRSLVALTICSLASSVYASNRNADYGSHSPNTKACPAYCAGTLNNASLARDYICGDSRLGPKKLPTKLAIGDIVDPYDRFGGLCPGEFLARWYNESAKSYIYPPNDGFQVNTDGVSIKGGVLLEPGILVDRFGSEFGTYVSPALAPYIQRALPPSNLDTPADNPTYPYNYHVYKVKRPFVVTSGPIAAWFGQPGQGVQYQMASNIMTLLSGGFLERVQLKNKSGSDGAVADPY